MTLKCRRTLKNGKGFKMKLFEGAFKGLWLGGVIIVQAEDETQARERMEKAISEAGFVVEEQGLKLCERIMADDGVVYFYDGDY